MEGRPLEDRELVAGARRGDATAYEELVKRYQGIAFRTAYLLTGNAADAEEAAQSGFVKAYYALARFRDDAAFRPWLLTIVGNEARNQRRSAWRRDALEVRLALDRRDGDAAPSPEAAVLAAEPRQALVDAINRLPEKDRLVISLRYFAELSEAETASALGCSKGTVKSRLSRALTKLRRSALLSDRGEAASG